MRAVQTKVSSAHISKMAPAMRVGTNRLLPRASPATAHIGRYVATDAKPSRDSQEEFHCENARHARDGRPRCSVDDSNPVVANTNPIASGASTLPRPGGYTPSASAPPSHAHSPKPAPDKTVKKITERAGFMGCLCGLP